MPAPSCTSAVVVLVHLTRTHVHADAGGAYNRAINGKISANICCDTATSLDEPWQ